MIFANGRMRLYGLSLLLLVAGFPPNSASAEIVLNPSSASISLYSTGMDATLTGTVDDQLDYSILGGLTLNGHASTTSYAGALGANLEVLALASFTSTATWRTDQGNLHLKLEGYANGNYQWAYMPSAGGNGTISWSDNISIVWNKGGVVPILPYDELFLKYHLTGNLQGSTLELDPNFHLFAYAGVEVSVNSESFSAGVNAQGQTGPEGNQLELSSSLSYRIPAEFDPLGLGLKASFVTNLRSHAEATYGFSISAFNNSLKFTGLTFEDGTTPESHGFDVVFGSGIASPNASAVPESSTLLILIILSLVVAGVAFRRGRAVSPRKAGLLSLNN